MREAMNLETTKVGDIIPFGAPHWRVLDIQNDKALLLSENVIEERAYNKSFTGATWETCTLRQYLNEKFYNNFSAEEKTRIAGIRMTKHNNPWFRTRGGNATTDKIFLLSLKELIKYFGDSGQLWNRPSNSTHIINDRYNSVRIALDSEKTAARWWLRSPGYYSNLAANVLPDGYVDVSGYYSDYNSGVRPALWLNL